MSIQELVIGTISLKWGDWVAWNVLKVDNRSKLGVSVPRKPGVYEVRRIPKFDRRLTIGKAANLRGRVKSGLVRGVAKHSTGKRIRENENGSNLQVRWAVTYRPGAAEEELHQIYRKRFGKLPKYVKCT
ncbi:MAG TPA: hypothetical protein VKV95_08075 [Terriglobia bacterium]|nr:hypothetical protein [Terriglobia bacterium]